MIYMRLSKLLLPLYTIVLATSCSGTTVAPNATSVSFESDTYIVEVGKSITLNAKVSPSNAKDKELVWSIYSGSTYASVDNGVVTGKAEGTARIRARLKSNSKLYAFCTVNVLDEIVPVTGISFESTTVEVMERKYTTLTPVISPSNATNKNVTWKSSNTSVVTVTDGSIRGLKKGTATITATTQDGGFSATATVTVTENTSPLDDYTILVYMCGADLESSYANKTKVEGYSWDYVGLACSDILEILSVSGQPDDVNIVFQTGGANTWTTNSSASKSQEFHTTYGSEDISSTYLQRWHVENKKIVKDGSNLTYASMGLTSTFQSFLEYGLSEYPAERTGVILWNHGGGLLGACFDEKADDDSLEPFEMVSAVDGAFKNTGLSGQKLEWIGFDCCLMQVQDIAYNLSNYFNYMIASEETESGYGWDYDTWVDDLYNHQSTETILKAIVDGFIAENGGSSSENDQTLSYLDLKYAADYRTAWENMAGQLKSKIKSSNKTSFGNLVKSCKYYAGSDYYAYGLFDAKDFVNKLSSNSTFNPGSTYTKAVLNAHSKLVKYSKKGGGAGNSNGLTMFWNIYSDWYYRSTYEINGYSDKYGFPNWDYLNSTFGGTDSGY